MNPNVTAQLGSVIDDITEQFRGLAQQMQQLSSTLQRLASSGLAATSEGNKLSYAWLLLSRQIAAITLPVVNFLVEKMLQLTSWFSRLSGDAQFLLLKVGLVAASFTVLTPILSALLAILNPMSLVIGVLANALIYFFTQTELGQSVLDAMSAALQFTIKNWETVKTTFEAVTGALVKIFEVVVAGFLWMGIKIVGIIESILDWIPGTDGAAESLKGFRQNMEAMKDSLLADAMKPILVSGKADPNKASKRARQDVNPTGFNFESLSASFERITSEANKKDLAMDLAKQQLKVQEQIAENTKPMAKAAPPKGDL